VPIRKKNIRLYGLMLSVVFLFPGCVSTSAIGVSPGQTLDKTGAVSALAGDSRREQAKRYVDEFADGRFRVSYPKIYQALIDAFTKLPEDVFVEVTDRDRPMIFVLAITSGIARYANSTEFILREFDPPTFKDGFYIVVLGDELEGTADSKAIEGVVLHETAHRYLEHLRAEEFSCEMELETNRLVREWGFEGEYKKASGAFGSKAPGDSPCSDAGKK